MSMHGRREQRGFTLVEVTIALAIVALAVAIAIPAISGVTYANLRRDAGKLSGFLRRSYDDAALGGQTHRVVFDLTGKIIKTEATEQVLAFEPDSNILAEAGKAKQELTGALTEAIQAEMELRGDTEDEDEAMDVNPMAAFFSVGQLGDMGGMAGAGEFASVENGQIELDDDVRLLDVWIEGMDEAATEGEVYLYFFPHGYTQQAIIHLEDVDHRIFSLQVRALTGKVIVKEEYVEPPK